MTEPQNEIYTRVDEAYIESFSIEYADFIKSLYYEYYCHFCFHRKRSPLSKTEFYLNMHHRRIQLFQLCCPYCGAFEIILHDKRIQKTEGYNYCPHCGRGSTLENIRMQISRFIRTHEIHRKGLLTKQKEHPNKEEWLLAYDCYQMEIIELASIIEVLCRNYFEALGFLGTLDLQSEYFKKAIEKYTGNDFMNIEKANDHFKKAYGINIKAALPNNVWNDLIDIVNLRNMMVHNNGMIDDKFKKSQSFPRLQDHMDGNLFKLANGDITNYFESVIIAVTEISNLYLKEYYARRNKSIANHYFNNPILTKEV